MNFIKSEFLTPVIVSVVVSLLAIVGNYYINVFSWEEVNYTKSKVGFWISSIVVISCIVLLVYKLNEQYFKPRIQLKKEKPDSNNRKVRQLRKKMRRHRGLNIFYVISVVFLTMFQIYSIVNILTLKEIATLMKSQIDFSINTSPKLVDSEQQHKIFISEIEQIGSFSSSISLTNRIYSLLRKEKETYNLPIDIEIVDNNEIDRIKSQTFKNGAFLIKGSYDDRVAYIEVEDFSVFNHPLEKFLRTFVKNKELIENIRDTYPKHEGESKIISEPIDKGIDQLYKLEYSIPSQVNFFIFRILGKASLSQDIDLISDTTEAKIDHKESLEVTNSYLTAAEKNISYKVNRLGFSKTPVVNSKLGEFYLELIFSHASFIFNRMGMMSKEPRITTNEELEKEHTYLENHLSSLLFYLQKFSYLKNEISASEIGLYYEVSYFLYCYAQYCYNSIVLEARIHRLKTQHNKLKKMEYDEFKKDTARLNELLRHYQDLIDVEKTQEKHKNELVTLSKKHLEHINREFTEDKLSGKSKKLYYILNQMLKTAMERPVKKLDIPKIDLNKDKQAPNNG